MQNSLVYALHGFLGLGADWAALKKSFPSANWITPSLFSDSRYFEKSVDQLADLVFQDIQKNAKSTKIFIGYSLGGRVGLQVLKKYPNLFEQFIFLSVNPGLQSVVEKAERLQNDAKWASSLQTLTWLDFLKAWNAQAVFAGSVESVRSQDDFNQQQILRALTEWSLGAQEDFRDVIKANQHKVTWFVGEKDSKFLNIADDMKQKKILLGYKRIFSGHRILFDPLAEPDLKLALSATGLF